jgi:hypothetical protein
VRKCLILLLILILILDGEGEHSGNDLDSYSESTWFESWSGHWLFSGFWRLFSVSPSKFGIKPRLGHDRILSNPSFISSPTVRSNIVRLLRSSKNISPIPPNKNVVATDYGDLPCTLVLRLPDTITVTRIIGRCRDSAECMIRERSTRARIPK